MIPEPVFWLLLAALIATGLFLATLAAASRQAKKYERRLDHWRIQARDFCSLYTSERHRADKLIRANRHLAGRYVAATNEIALTRALLRQDFPEAYAHIQTALTKATIDATSARLRLVPSPSAPDYSPFAQGADAYDPKIDPEPHNKDAS